MQRQRQWHRISITVTQTVRGQKWVEATKRTLTDAGSSQSAPSRQAFLRTFSDWSREPASESVRVRRKGAIVARAGPRNRKEETVSVGARGKRALNYREADSERACEALDNNQQRRKPGVSQRFLVGLGPGGRRGWCEEWARRG